MHISFQDSRFGLGIEPAYRDQHVGDRKPRTAHAAAI